MCSYRQLQDNQDTKHGEDRLIPSFFQLHRLPGGDFGGENFYGHRKQPPRRRLRPAGHMGIRTLSCIFRQSKLAVKNRKDVS